MARHSAIRDEIRKEKKKFKDLKFTAKIQYIWDYYRYYILGVLIVILTIVAFINSYIRTNYDVVCYIAVAEGSISGGSDDSDIFTKDLTEYLGIDGKKERVDFDYSYNLVTDLLDQEDANISINKIYTLASIGSMDGYLTDRQYIDFFSTDKEAFLYDLRELLTVDELDYLSDKLVYFTDGNGDSIPIAVDLTDAPKIKDSGLKIENPCYGIVVTSQYVDNAVAFIRYAYELH